MNTNKTVSKLLMDAQSLIELAMRELEPNPKVDKAMSFAELKRSLDDGKIHLDVGDHVCIKHSEIGAMDWTVIGVGIDGQGACAKRQTVTLMMTPCLEEYRWFCEPTKQYPWGHNAWRDSRLRKYLNGEFLDGFSSEDKAALIAAQKITYHNEQEGGGAYKTVDKVFALSASEMGFTGDDIRNEGAVYPFFDGSPENRKKMDAESGDGSYYWLRSATPWSLHTVRRVYPDGRLSNNGANYSNGVAAACVI